MRIFYANEQIEHPDIIYPGDKLRIPDDDEKLNERQIPGAVGGLGVNKVQARANRVEAFSLPTNAGVWEQLARCESGGNWSINTGNGYYGGLQFTLSSWRAVGGSGYPHQAGKAEQIARGQALQARQGWAAWPACGAKLGLR